VGRLAVLSEKSNPHLFQNWRNSRNLERSICESTVYPTAFIAYLQLRKQCWIQLLCWRIMAYLCDTYRFVILSIVFYTQKF